MRGKKYLVGYHIYGMGALLRPRFLILVIIASIITFYGVSYSVNYSFELAAGHSQMGAVAAATTTPLDEKLAYLIAGGYIVIFFGMMIEGPMVTAAAAFAASLGYFDIWAVLLLATGADLTADIAFYMLGYFSRVRLLEKHGHRVGLSRARLKKIERLLHTHPAKTILALKLLPGFAVVGLPLVGAARVPVQKYAAVCLGFIFPSALLFTMIGYFFGHAYIAITAYLQNAEYFMLFAIVATLLIYYVFKKATASFARRLEPI
jgi:membrane protein DedA with SNARE-associated domain